MDKLEKLIHTKKKINYLNKKIQEKTDEIEDLVDKYNFWKYEYFLITKHNKKT